MPRMLTRRLINTLWPMPPSCVSRASRQVRHAPPLVGCVGRCAWRLERCHGCSTGSRSASSAHAALAAAWLAPATSPCRLVLSCVLCVFRPAAVEVPLDGTVYDLATGKVLSWCPKNTLARKVLGGLKDRAEPVDLPVYPVKVQGGKVFVKFI